MSQLVGVENKRLQLKILKETEGNPQHMDDKTFLGIVESMKNKGWLLDAPVIWEKADNEFQIISGHHRVKAAIQAGIIETDCKVLKGITEEQAKILVLEANQRKGEFDNDLLTPFIDDLINNYDYDLDSIINEVGFDDDIINNKIQNDVDLSDKLKSLFEIIIECENEKEQEKIYNELNGQKYKCRILTL